MNMAVKIFQMTPRYHYSGGVKVVVLLFKITFSKSRMTMF